MLALPPKGDQPTDDMLLQHTLVYPTIDLLGTLFAKPSDRNCESIHRLLPILKEDPD
jgi:hypothetical protein